MNVQTAVTAGRNSGTNILDPWGMAVNLAPHDVATYVAALDAAWSAHLAPRDAGAPTVVSLFAGAGGSSLGYGVAGFRELLAVEWEDNAAGTLRLNFPHLPVYHGDIAELTVEQSLQLTGLARGELDVLDGSPPCQGFSTAGKRQIEDGRNQLFKEYVRLLRGLRPKVFVMENVSGMVKGKMKLIFAQIMRELKGSGYRVSAKLMNAMYFGVPQRRERMIIIGVRSDLCDQEGSLVLPAHPGAQSRPLVFRQVCWDLRGNSSEDRLLPPVLLQCARYQPDTWSTNLRIYRHFKGNTASAMSLNWAGWDRVCGTITRSEISLSGIVHPDRERYISLAEAMRLASFPDRFQFTDRKNGIARIGNSVPPLFMRALAQHIREGILGRIHTGAEGTSLTLNSVDFPNTRQESNRN
jgi:DNA (cytosine-5)-methyltransferase 1